MALRPPAARVHADRVIVAAALAGLSLLAWLYTLRLAASMPMADGMAMPGAPTRWTPVDFLATFVMWTVMMVGMMTPSAMPMVLVHARIARQAAARGRPLAATGLFVTGYLLAWTLFSLAATGGQWWLQRTVLLTPMLASGSTAFSGLVLAAAGLWQWTGAKQACLRRCQTPWRFLEQHGGFGRSPAAALSLGLRHGAYCVGCCWALMALLFVGGVMNVLWIAAIALFVLAEKLLPTQRWLPLVAGGALVAWGTALLVLAATGR